MRGDIMSKGDTMSGDDKQKAAAAVSPLSDRGGSPAVQVVIRHLSYNYLTSRSFHGYWREASSNVVISSISVFSTL